MTAKKMEELVSEIELSQNADISKKSRFDDLIREKERFIRTLTRQNKELLAKLNDVSKHTQSPTMQY